MQCCQRNPVLQRTRSSYFPRASRRVLCDAPRTPPTPAAWAGCGELPSPSAPAAAAPQAHGAAAPSPKLTTVHGAGIQIKTHGKHLIREKHKRDFKQRQQKSGVPSQISSLTFLKKCTGSSRMRQPVPKTTHCSFSLFCPSAPAPRLLLP